MTRKEQNKILGAKIESNVNQYKVGRMNAEISAFSIGDLNKYEFLKRIDLNYKPNALDKARFEFSSLCKTFSTGLDKNAQGYQEEGVIKLLKDIRDGLAGGIAPKGPGLDDPNNDDPNNYDPNNDDPNNDDPNNDDHDDYMTYYNNVSDLKTEEKTSEKVSTNALDKLKNNIETEMSNLHKIVKNKKKMNLVLN